MEHVTLYHGIFQLQADQIIIQQDGPLSLRYGPQGNTARDSGRKVMRENRRTIGFKELGRMKECKRNPMRIKEKHDIRRIKSEYLE